MGTGGGVSGDQSIVRYHLITFPFTFKGVIPGVEARCTGSITLEVVFGSPDNFLSDELIFDIVPFRSGYHALLGRTAFARFNVVPHYAYLKLKMPGPCGV